MWYGKQYKTKLKCNKYIQFLIAQMEETWFYERLFFGGLIAIIKEREIQYKGCKINKS